MRKGANKGAANESAATGGDTQAADTTAAEPLLSQLPAPLERQDAGRIDKPQSSSGCCSDRCITRTANFVGKLLQLGGVVVAAALMGFTGQVVRDNKVASGCITAFLLVAGLSLEMAALKIAKQQTHEADRGTDLDQGSAAQMSGV